MMKRFLKAYLKGSLILCNWALKKDMSDFDRAEIENIKAHFEKEMVRYEKQ